MADKLFKENGESSPAYQYVDDTPPPSGYTETDDPIDWDAAADRLIDNEDFTASTLWTQIKTSYDALGDPSPDQDKVASTWFIIDKTERDLVHSQAQQLENAEVLSNLLNQETNKKSIDAFVTDIVDADVTAINKDVQGQASKNDNDFLTHTENWRTNLTSYLASKALLYFPGTDKFGIPSKIEAMVQVTGAITGSMKIVDLSHSGNLICEITNITNIGFTLRDMGVLTNLSTDPAMWQMQIKTSSTSHFIETGGYGVLN